MAAKMVKTVAEAQAIVANIRRTSHDFEKAHVMEDDLWEGVLRAIAQGMSLEDAALAPELAKAALKSKRIHFARVCA